MLGWLLLGMLLPVAAAAQSPDIRDLRPFLMLVVDTSGSMERRVNCPCLTSGCLECLPDCNLLNSGGVPPDGKKNRWALTLEALTGSFKDFQCEMLARTQANGATYDRNYSLPYHQPWDCSYPQTATDGNVESVCQYTATGVPNPLQNKDGILDTYESRVRFGLMTFDGVATYTGASDLVEASKFSRSASDSEAGLWSYAGPKAVHYPGCQFDYMVDSGARNKDADEGALVSLNSCATPPCDAQLLNADIQDQLLKTRPYGGTPIAASLDDLYFHLATDLTDSFGSCRNRLGMLITDGYPDLDFRDLGCDCTQNTVPAGSGYCGPSANNDPSTMKCPYPLPEDVARDLKNGRGSDGPQLKELFVVGLAVEDTVVRDKLNAIALEGGGTPYVNPIDSKTDVAYFADDVGTLVKQLTYIINKSISPISRTVPVMGQARSGTRQYQVSTGFELSTEAGFPWTGILERRRFECNGTAVNEVQLADRDQFHKTLNNQATAARDTPDGRNLITPKVPLGAGITVDSALFHAASGASPCGTPGNTALSETGTCHLIKLSDLTVTELGLSSDAAGIVLQNSTLDWMYANSGVRVGNALGDIYHSTPVIVGSPQFDTTDASFNEFRASETVADRPVMLYVGSNDGILHAFAMEAYVGPTGGTSPYVGLTLTEGQEVWGFVPAMFQNNLPANQITHQFMVDGSPVVKDVYFNREHSTVGLQSTPAGNALEYHTVLVAGLRSGGAGYYALDVTNPAKPEFLWQFTDSPDMGDTYGQPAIIQAVYDPNGGTDYRERAVAVLPGGKGIKGSGAGDCPNGISYTSYLDGTDSFTTFAEIPTGTTLKMRHRRDLPCYEKAGRALYFVDVETGKLIKKITGPTGPVLPAPIVSTPVMYQAAVGSLATEGYVTDQEGVIWRIDISAIDPKPTDPRAGWTMRPYHDLFWDDGQVINGVINGEVSYEKPVLTTDPEGRLVVITGTGDTDNFDKDTTENRVASLTTVIDPAADLTALTPDDYAAAMNWEKRVRSDGTGLVPSELVTGSMTLFQGQLFFATFISVSNQSSACDLGTGRLHVVDYRARDTTNPNGSNPQTFPPVDILGLTDPDIAINVPASGATQNAMVMGLGITQRPSCAVVDTGILDVWGQSIPVIDQLSDPSTFVVAQVSGAPSLQRAGSRLGSLQVQVNRVMELTRLVGWATTTD